MKIGLTNIVSCKIGSTQVNRVYIGSTLIWSYSAFDSDAQLFITNASITDPTQQSAINGLVTNLKNYGIWSKMKAIYPFVGGTASQHKFNLKNPLDTDAAFRLVFSGGWTHSATGALPNGTNAYANTFFKGTNWTTKDNASMSYYSRTNVNGSQVEIGLYDSTTALNNSLAVRYNDSFQSLLNLFGNNGWLLVANTNSSGQFIANRYIVNSLNSWKNGVKQGEISSTPFAGAYSSTLNYMLGAYNDTGTPAAYSSKQVAFSSFGDGLTDTEAANYYTAVQTFQTTLNRHVGVPIVSDSDAQAFLNAAVIEDVTQANAVNTLVTNLKGYGIWTKMKALYPFVGGTAAQHKYNLKDPRDLDIAYRLTFSGGVTHSANGIIGNGVNAVAKTKLINDTNISIDNKHMAMYQRNILTDPTGASMGIIANNRFYLNFSGSNYSTFGMAQSAFTIQTPQNGMFLMSKTATNSFKYYQNTLTPITKTGTNVSAPYEHYLLCDNDPAQPNIGHDFSVANLAFVSLGDGLTDTEAANYYTAVQTFQTTLGRNV